MRQLVILSGKGGTGKTSLSASFAHLSAQAEKSPKPVLVDADVDAANLSLVLSPSLGESHEFWGGKLALIDKIKCTGCGNCVSVCRYDAILPDRVDRSLYWVDPIACDGCAACVYACPENAISMVPQQEGEWFRSSTPYGTLFHAELFPGRENSGKLVTLIKQQARLWGEENNSSMVIIDGPPGIGCPVISACAGADLGLVVAEPGVAGVHDMKRIVEVLRHFKVPVMICINKADIYPQGAEQIRQYASSNSCPLLGEIPFDDHMSQAISNGLPVTRSFPKSPASLAVQSIWDTLLVQLDQKGGR